MYCVKLSWHSECYHNHSVYFYRTLKKARAKELEILRDEYKSLKDNDKNILNYSVDELRDKIDTIIEGDEDGNFDEKYPGGIENYHFEVIGFVAKFE